MFLRIMPHQDTPHDCSHAHQMAFKSQSDRRNIPWCCIPMHPRKRSNIINMNWYCRKLAFLCLHLPFGTTPALVEYTTISKAEIDLGGDLLTDMSWDAKNIQSPHRHLLPREDYLPESETLVKADQLAMNIKSIEAPMDGYIDEIITITIDNPFWVECAKTTAFLVIHTISRRLHLEKPLKCDDPLPLRKLAGEGQLAKLKTCLVWYLQTRSLRLFLLIEKDTAWVQ